MKKSKENIYYDITVSYIYDLYRLIWHCFWERRDEIFKRYVLDGLVIDGEGARNFFLNKATINTCNTKTDCSMSQKLVGRQSCGFLFFVWFLFLSSSSLYVVILVNRSNTSIVLG